MITTVLGLATAISYGFADFFAAIAAKKFRVVFVTAIASISGLFGLFCATPLFGAIFSTDALLWGLGAGLASVSALIALYASLAIGPISIVSPLGAVISAIVPALIGIIVHGETFSAIGWLAILAALVAIVLVAFVPGENIQTPSKKGIWLSILAGTSIGIAITCLAQSPADSGIASILIMRSTAATILGAYVLVTFISKGKKVAVGEQPLRNKMFLVIMGAGLLDASANVLFTLASRSGSLVIVGVLTALYPLGTILLARVILKEKVATIQKVGIALTLLASVLLAVA